MKEIVYIAVPINKRDVFHEGIVLKGLPASPLLTQSRAIDGKVRVYDIISKTTRLVHKWQIYSKNSIDNIKDNYMAEMDQPEITKYEHRRGV